MLASKPNVTISSVQRRFHNATTIKLSEIAEFYEPINRTNWIVHNNKLHSVGWMNCISMKVTCEKLHSIELKSYCYGYWYWYFHDCATFTSDDHSYININCKVLVVFGVVLVRSTSKTFSYKFLLIELLGALGRCVLVINALQSITLLINSEIVCYLNPLEKWVFHRHWHRHLGEAFYWQIKPTCCCCSWFFFLLLNASDHFIA